jgi:hypothetical protein
MGRDRELEAEVRDLQARQERNERALHTIVAILVGKGRNGGALDYHDNVLPALEPFVTRYDLQGRVTRVGVGDTEG